MQLSTRAVKVKAHPYQPCGTCHDGWKRGVMAGGYSGVMRCECFTAWQREHAEFNESQRVSQKQTRPN